MKPAHLLSVVALLVGCGTTCPSGFVLDDMQRCVAAADGAIEDAGETEQDGGVLPDGCRLSRHFRDVDGDGHGDADAAMMACEPPDGFVLLGDDCDDTCATCWEGAPELCDGDDNDCDDSIDEDAMMSFYVDGDGDGHGTGAAMTGTCMLPPGHASSGDDCDDSDDRRAPGLPETCDTRDNDCDEIPDDDFDCSRHETVPCTTSCGTTGQGTCTPDCELPSGDACFGPSEVCDATDQDCDGVIDEGAGGFGPRRALTESTGRIVVLATASGYVAVYAVSDGIRARAFDASGAPVGTEATVTTNAPSSFDAAVVGSRLVVSFVVANAFVMAVILDASTLAITVSQAGVAGLAGIQNVALAVSETRALVLFSSTSSLRMTTVPLTTLMGASTPVELTALTTSDFSMASRGPLAFVAFASDTGDIRIRTVAIDTATSTSSTSFAVTTTTEIERAPAVTLAEHTTSAQLGVAYVRGTASRLAILDVAPAGTLTAVTDVSVLSSATTTSAVQGSGLDVAWGDGRWLISALAPLSGTTSAWRFVEVVPAMGSSPRVYESIAVETPVSENRGTSLATGSMGRALLGASQVGGVARVYPLGCF